MRHMEDDHVAFYFHGDRHGIAARVDGTRGADRCYRPSAGFYEHDAVVAGT
jgi:hypothetical protein